MKPFFLIIAAIFVLTGCQRQHEQQAFVTISGKAKNQNSDSLTVFNPTRTFSKTIKVDEKGFFKDTLKVLEEDKTYLIYDGRQGSSLYLKNGFDLKLDFDGKALESTLVFSGTGALENNCLNEYNAIRSKEVSFMGLSKEVSLAKLDSTIDGHISYIKNFPDLPSEFVIEQTALLEKERAQKSEWLKKGHIDSYETYFEKYNADRPKHLQKGQPSPSFTNYRNFNGGMTSLQDLRGKYVYIDLWATWCSPCKKEFPFLADIEKEYHDKNIVFVSISLDREADYDYWRQMVKDKNLVGVQLIADSAFQSSFVRGYGGTGVPRFILLDPEGRIVDSNAPRPSYRYLLKDLFNNLDI
nr:TlpA disulfide reductase family protein [Allomuricauda sp.]